MDKYLLTLWNSISSGNIKQEELAITLQLSPKQITRYMKKWTLEGWLIFIPGRGRGNVSNLEWLKNVEEVYEDQLMQIIEKESIETSSKYLLFDWSQDSKLRLMNKFRMKFGFVQNRDQSDKLIIPRRYPLLTMHPLEALDIQSASMVANVFNRLVTVDEHGVISPELCHSWYETPSKLRLYLRKDIKFHDGSLLTANDVVICLEKLRHHPSFKDLWWPIQEIKVAAPLTLDILFTNGCSYCLQLLGTINSSIYKETNGHVVGTGSFYLEDYHELKITLAAFKDYFQERPLLDIVEFVQVPKDFDIIYRSAISKTHNSTFQVESDSGFGVVIMNTFRQSDINRKAVRNYLHHVIEKYRNEINQVQSRVLPNHNSCLIGQEQNYVVQEVNRPHFTKPLLVRVMNYTKKTTLWLKEIFEREGIPVELVSLSFEDMINNHAKNQQVDLFIHAEMFEMNQNFSFYFFLKNGHSPLAEIIKSDESLSQILEEYIHTPFKEWTSLNLKMERALLEASIMIPLYYEKRQIPFSTDLMNINIKHYGYVDFSKLWVRPNIEE